MVDNYVVPSGQKSLLVAMGCFWCGEQAFEQYAPGVTEAVSGYAGGTSDNPTYYDHSSAGHYEVVLVTYDPDKVSYEALVQYAWRNIDPFDGRGQFCDKGTSYRPAIFFETEEEREIAERVLDDILKERPDWDRDSIAVPLLERPAFWTAEGYHQDYYLKKPRNYGYYKNACGRTKRLEDVWGEEEYGCYHDTSLSCFGGNVTNNEGMEVVAEVNIKNAPKESSFLMPTWGIVVLSMAAFAFVYSGYCILSHFQKNKKKRFEKEKDDGGGNGEDSEKGSDSFSVEGFQSSLPVN
eukprot:CAMPEP_0113538310 /NCGR_PEP_ID=MMETSP0015_2-20120614/7294_1 /TAXON_ID=2838 /ORGANISM="Odontella" /LENGTH=293 /DNA_ID=CAMNT_0000437869 /DNA_START=164 /DNA_END=1045 /DNA_ORIENTATION=+ /assembly_acc=CAM_ASM_000160